ncbi:Plancitoxin-1 [Halotydeus destructor]|nr:Plancitoxin-1 [Halotydeus destructor]
MRLVFHSHVVVLFAALLSQLMQCQLSCRDDDDNPVDWYIVYKIPKLQKQVNPFNTGYSYVYMTSNQKSSWTLSPKQITDSSSIFANTLKSFYSPDPNVRLSHIMYNDQPPTLKNGGDYAHAKGFVGLGPSSGFWLIHSVPRFPLPINGSSRYGYPSNARENGQSAICITINSRLEGDNVALQLLTMKPKIYSYALTDDLVQMAPHFQDLIRRKWSKKISRTVPISTLGGQRLESFSKSSTSNNDLYSDLIAPALSVNLFAETWRKGAGHSLSSECNETYHVNNVQRVQLTLDGVNSVVDWEYTEDHAKWAVSDTQEIPFVCVGDINRMRSQFKRGGGSLCISDTNLWSVLKLTIMRVEPCPRIEKSLPSQGGFRSAINAIGALVATLSARFSN